MKKYTSLLTLIAIFVFTHATNADLVDDLSTTANFSPGFNGTTAVSDGNFVTITRGDDTMDSGIDWRPGGTGFFSYDDASVLTVTPFDDAGNNSQYDVNILYFDSAGGFLSEVNWLSTTGTTPETTNVTTLFSDPNVDQFFVRIRVINSEGTTKVFDEISAVNAVPEPTATIILMMIAGLTTRRRRA